MLGAECGGVGRVGARRGASSGRDGMGCHVSVVGNERGCLAGQVRIVRNQDGSDSFPSNSALYDVPKQNTEVKETSKRRHRRHNNV